jgi:IS30 family transposase
MAKGYHHLTQTERCQIYALKASNMSQIKIASMLGFSASTLSRELKRNRGKRGYRHQQANTLAIERRYIASKRSSRMTAATIELIRVNLRKKWSPEQIAGRLKMDGIFISHETIYKHVWADKKNGGDLYKHLRHGGRKYAKKRSGTAGRGCIPNRIDIKERPSVVETKSRIGDWEGDLIIGTEHKGALLTYVDRKAKFTKMTKLANKTMAAVYTGTTRIMAPLAKNVHTITYDNGKAFSGHLSISKVLQAQCFFATPYHSWERGLNEHTNGLIRQYFPKKSDLTCLSDEQVQAVEDALNDRPRKVLNYRTPREVFYGADDNQFIALRG